MDTKAKAQKDAPKLTASQVSAAWRARKGNTFAATAAKTPATAAYTKADDSDDPTSVEYKPQFQVRPSDTGGAVVKMKAEAETEKAEAETEKAEAEKDVNLPAKIVGDAFVVNAAEWAKKIAPLARGSKCNKTKTSGSALEFGDDGEGYTVFAFALRDILRVEGNAKATLTITPDGLKIETDTRGDGEEAPVVSRKVLKWQKEGVGIKFNKIYLVNLAIDADDADDADSEDADAEYEETDWVNDNW